ncbi:MAG: sigma-70 family RNA polymerase sigma factor, partial [Myxococcota bacterium]
GAMEKLSDDQRQVVLLRELEGLSYREIAEIMEIPEGTVMSRLFYARKKLQKLLEAEGVTER